jgi:tetratricopeptide (TPR) repeat protein
MVPGMTAKTRIVVGVGSLVTLIAGGAASGTWSAPPPVRATWTPPSELPSAAEWAEPAGDRSQAPMVGPKNARDAFGYPLDRPDRRALRAMLSARDFDGLSTALETYQALFEADFRREFAPREALEAFSVNDPELGPLLDAWVAARPDSWTGYAARGAYAENLGWARRGTNWASETSEEQFRGMREAHLEAVADLGAALTLRPGLVAAYRLLIRISKDGVGEPWRLLEQALALCPLCYDVRATYLNATTPRWGGSYLGMERAAAEGAAHAEQNPRLGLLLGFTARERCQVLRLEEHPWLGLLACEAALRHGEEAEALRARAEIDIALGWFERAVADLDRAMALRPGDARLAARRYWPLMQLGRRKEATDALMQATAIDPVDDEWRATAKQALASWWLQQAREFYRRGRIAEATQLAEAAALMAPALSPEASALSGYCLLAAGKPEEAMRLAQSLVERNPEAIDPTALLAQLQVRNGELDQSLATWNRYLERRPDSGSAYRLRAGVWGAKHDEVARARDLERACRLGEQRACPSGGRSP